MSPRTLGENAEKLKSIVNLCDTGIEAAKLLGISAPRVYQLADKLGITKWKQKNPKKAALITAVCKECGKEFQRRKIYKMKNIFCSKICQGKFIGRNYGFAKYPEHAKYMKSSVK